MALVLDRGVAMATFAQLLNAGSGINSLSVDVTDHRRASPRNMMLALVTNHPGRVEDDTARVVYKSSAHMQPWVKVGVITGNRHFDNGAYRRQLQEWVTADANVTQEKADYLAAKAASDADPTDDALNAAEKAALAAYRAARSVLNDTPEPEAFDETVDWTSITPDWDYETGRKLAL